ncbi:MAG: DUF2007 domain-containing protein [Pseudomonadota bacterium]
MEEILRTNDPALLSFAMAILSGEDIEAVVFDVHMSVMEGSIGVFPRRLMVASDDARAARRILKDHELETSPPV